MQWIGIHVGERLARACAVIWSSDWHSMVGEIGGVSVDDVWVTKTLCFWFHPRNYYVGGLCWYWY